MKKMLFSFLMLTAITLPASALSPRLLDVRAIALSMAVLYAAGQPEVKWPTTVKEAATLITIGGTFCYLSSLAKTDIRSVSKLAALGFALPFFFRYKEWPYPFSPAALIAILLLFRHRYPQPAR